MAKYRVGSQSITHVGEVITHEIPSRNSPIPSSSPLAPGRLAVSKSPLVPGAGMLSDG